MARQTAFFCFCLTWLVSAPLFADTFQVVLRNRTTDEKGWLRIEYTPQSWDANQTAVIVCDMWDSHHCLNAVRRVKQLAPRIDELLKVARAKGATIIHAPSSCVDFYRDHPARRHVLEIPRSKNPPKHIDQWCHWKNSHEEQLGYPIDHSDGGEDDDPEEHERWAQQLEAMGRNPRSPWKRQIDAIEIADEDFITDDGIENWSILEHRGIKNVMLVGVHTNMCVLGRPFGLRHLANNGINVVLVRDLTDTMYNPKMPPFVSHFSGTDLVIEHVESNVCPTIASDQVTGHEPLRFRKDNRPHVVLVIGEQEYETQATLPKFAKENLYKDCRVSYVLADPDQRNHFSNVAAIEDADLLFISVRRRAPSSEMLSAIRRHVAEGKPVVGIRTASHAFALRDSDPPPGHAVWPEFDGSVFGGNYHGHHANDQPTRIWPVKETPYDQTIAKGVHFSETAEFVSAGSLYKTSPLRPGTRIILMGRIDESAQPEPVAWTFLNDGNGRSFYTSLGCASDFDNPGFCRLLTNAVHWALDYGHGRAE